MARERDLVTQVAQYLQLQYPAAIFRFDLAADLKLTMGQASRHKRLHPRRGFPDLAIFVPMNGKAGQFIELKREGERVRLRSGELSKDPHIQEQAAMHEDLRRQGYAADFAVGFDAAKKLVDDYLSGKLLPESDQD
ncbi:UNVERIFIED_ORG: hypothetical protein ABID57_000729 [Arthrobacter sp. UYEF1]